jgi:hypothetical protein
MMVIATLSLLVPSRFPPGRKSDVLRRPIRTRRQAWLFLVDHMIAGLAAEHLQSAVSVVKRIARARPFLKTESRQAPS